MKLIPVLLSCILLSCSKNFADDSNLCAKEKCKYEAQLEHAIQKGKVCTRGDEHVPSLEKYYEYQEIHSDYNVELLVEEMFSASSYIVVPEPDTQAPQLLSVCEIEALAGKPIREVYDAVIRRLRDQVKPGMKIMKTVWLCDGKEYPSKCIVSLEDGVLFDPIGSYIVEESPSSEPMMSPPSTLTESESEAQTVRDFSLSNRYTDVFDVVCYEYSISCQSAFAGNILTDYEMSASYTNAIGWSCCARIEHLEGTIDESTYHTFTWGWGYSSTSTVSISFSGVGFSISGSAHSSTGTEVHKAQEVLE